MINQKDFELPKTLIGEKVVLTRREACHNSDLWRLIDGSREFLRPWLSWVDKTKSIGDVAFITELFLENWNKHDSFEYVFLNKDTGRLVGAGGVNRLDFRNHIAEFGYYRDKDAGGRGYVSEFVKLLEPELIKRGIHRLEIRADVENTPSQKVAQRCGYVLEAKHIEAIFDGEKYKDEFRFVKLSGE